MKDLQQKHMKEILAFERAKASAWKNLQQEHKAVLSIFSKDDVAPPSTLKRLGEQKDAFNREWGEDGKRFKNVLEKQQVERDKVTGIHHSPKRKRNGDTTGKQDFFEFEQF